MQLFDYGALLTGLLCALFSLHESGKALRGAIFAYLAIVPDARWTRSYELRKVFGSAAYTHLRALARDGLVETRTAPGGPERGRRDDYYYRQSRRQVQ